MLKRLIADNNALFLRRQALEDVLKYPDTSTSTVMNTLHEYLVMPIRDVLSEVC